MIEHCRRGWILSIVVVLLVACTKELSPEEIVEKVREKYESIEDYQADYVQTIQIMGKEMVLKGKVLAKGDKLRMDLSALIPEQNVSMDQLVISDGNVMWTYNSMANTAQKIELFRLSEETRQKIMKQQNVGFWVPEFENEIEVSKKANSYILETEEQPESQAAQFFTKRWYYVGEDDFLLHRIEFYADDELGVSIELEDIQLNSGISEERFVYEPSEDVEIIDMTDGVEKMIKK